VLLVDDQELIRTGLRGTLRIRYGFEIVGELDSGEGVVDAVTELSPDVVLMAIGWVDAISGSLSCADESSVPTWST
jgi:DNA-binding NarL/FixJ family response regulator